jgi:2,3,4,5-tetrahydropyridine-2,6-dicarboxylate N-succinyltransferase
MTQDNATLQATIDAAWENRANLSPSAAPQDVLHAVDSAIDQLNSGKLRVATPERQRDDARRRPELF